MLAVVATVAVGALGVLWGSNHPERPFKELYDTVRDTLTQWCKKEQEQPEQPKEQSYDSEKETE